MSAWRIDTEAAAAVTPGRFDRAAYDYFGEGQCHSLALAIHERTWWDLVGQWWREEDSAPAPDHVLVRHRDTGELVDVEWLWYYVASSPPQAETRRIEAAEVHEWVRDKWLRPLDMALARSMVPAVLTIVEGRRR